jgi:hypothetical protein
MTGKVKIGCCGFPVGRRQYLAALQVVELQQTFYSPPPLDTARPRREEAPPDFEFTLKAWQLITHEVSSPTYRRLKRALSPEERHQAGSFQDTPVVRAAWETIGELAGALKARLVVFRARPALPPTAENIARLRRFFSEVPRDRLAFAWESRGGPGPGRRWRPWTLLPPHLFQDALPASACTGWEATGIRIQNRTSQPWLAWRRAYAMFNNLSMWTDARRFQEALGRSAAPG